MPNLTMCDDLTQARLNRERVKTKDDMAYYSAQAHAVAQWQWGEPCPPSIACGDLPYVGKATRYSRYEEAD